MPNWISDFWSNVTGKTNRELLEQIREQQKVIQMTAQEAVALVTEVQSTLVKAHGEIRGRLDSLLAKITELEQAVANQPVSPDVVSAITGLRSAATLLDDIVPDPVPEPPTN